MIGYKKCLPYLEAFSRVEWFLFGSLTWKFESRRALTDRAEFNRQRDFRSLLTVFCIKHRLRYKSLAFYRAREFGGSMQPHYHFLIARHGLEDLSAVQCALTLKCLWEKILTPCDCRGRGIGTADVRPYEGSTVLEYCLKREFDDVGCELEKSDFLSTQLLRLASRSAPKPRSEKKVEDFFEVPFLA